MPWATGYNIDMPGPITVPALSSQINTQVPSGQPGGIPAIQLRNILQDMNAQRAFIVTPQMFGAVGDGSHDDYPAIHAADQALAATGGTLLFSPGTYRMSQADLIPSNVNWQGAGTGATFIKNDASASAPDNTALIIYATLTGDRHNYAGTSITYAINAPVEGDNTITTTTAGDAANFAANSIIMISGGLHSTNFWYPVWTTTVVSNNPGTGVVTLSETLPLGGAVFTLAQQVLTQPNNIKISDLTLIGTVNGAAQVLVAKNVLFDNVNFTSGPGGSALFDAQGCRNVTVNNCRGSGSNCVIDIIATFDSIVSNNFINGGNITFDGGSQNCIALGNTITDPQQSTGVPSGGIYAWGQNLRIIGNNVTGVPSGQAGINVFSQAVTVGGNVIVGNNISGANTSNTTGIGVNTSPNDIVASNTISNVQRGILLQVNSTGIIASNNLMIGVTTPYSFDGTSSFSFNITPAFWTILSPAGATPDVSNGNRFQFFQSGATNITSFVGGFDTEEITVLFQDSSSTLVASGSLHLSGSVNYNPASHTVMKFVNISGSWYELSRSSDN